ncbi:MFS transporter [soil metagenome]
MNSTALPAKRVSALGNPGYRWHFSTYMLAMMADNIEHVISYWVAFQKFHSPSLGGFAVISHWVPFLLFSIPVGALADRFDPRRIIQIGQTLFIFVSLAWCVLFVTDTLEVWHAMVLLTLHGIAGVLWQGPSQVLLYDIVGPALLPSAVRLNASARYLGFLVGPALGGLIMLTIGPRYGLLLNACFYLPLLLWLWKAPYGPKFMAPGAQPRRAVRSFADIWQTLRDVAGNPALFTMILLAGAASFFIGNAYHAQMPGFATDLGHGDPGTSYSMLLAADACGALLAGVLLERLGILRATPRTALALAAVWAVALTAFALVRSYPLALLVLFVAGFVELSFSSTAQTIVQLNAPNEIRGRVIGVFQMASSGIRTFSGITVGLIGGWIGIPASLAVSVLVLLEVIGALFARWRVSAAVPART